MIETTFLYRTFHRLVLSGDTLFGTTYAGGTANCCCRGEAKTSPSVNVQFTPTQYVDISASVSRKRSACYTHASQSSENYNTLQELVARMRGAESGHKQAEAYIRHVQSPDFSLPMVS